MSKLGLLAAGAVGYVLGARAGRERYDQIVEQAQRLWANPKVQRAASQAQDRARERSAGRGGEGRRGGQACGGRGGVGGVVGVVGCRRRRQERDSRREHRKRKQRQRARGEPPVTSR